MVLMSATLPPPGSPVAPLTGIPLSGLPAPSGRLPRSGLSPPSGLLRPNGLPPPSGFPGLPPPRSGVPASGLPLPPSEVEKRFVNIPTLSSMFLSPSGIPSRTPISRCPPSGIPTSSSPPPFEQVTPLPLKKRLDNGREMRFLTSTIVPVPFPCLLPSGSLPAPPEVRRHFID